MITRLSHATIYVLDQDEARDFYTDKLGFEVRMDQELGGFRWLTVGPTEQPDIELVLLQPAPPMFDPETAESMKSILAKGAMGTGVLRTNDLQATYEELKGKGVEFLQEPTERPWGFEATFRDNSGNWFSLTQDQ